MGSDNCDNCELSRADHWGTFQSPTSLQGAPLAFTGAPLSCTSSSPFLLAISISFPAPSKYANNKSEDMGKHPLLPSGLSFSQQHRLGQEERGEKVGHSTLECQGPGDEREHSGGDLMKARGYWSTPNTVLRNCVHA